MSKSTASIAQLSLHACTFVLCVKPYNFARMHHSLTAFYRIGCSFGISPYSNQYAEVIFSSKTVEP